MKKIAAVIPDRDELGYWTHPCHHDFHAAHPDDYENQGVYEEWLRQNGILHNHYVSMFGDGNCPEAVVDDYLEGNSGGCAGWEPPQAIPQVEGILLSIFDTEDGPYAGYGYYLSAEELGVSV